MSRLPLVTAVNLRVFKIGAAPYVVQYIRNFVLEKYQKAKTNIDLASTTVELIKGASSLKPKAPALILTEFLALLLHNMFTAYNVYESKGKDWGVPNIPDPTLFVVKERMRARIKEKRTDAVLDIMIELLGCDLTKSLDESQAATTTPAIITTTSSTDSVKVINAAYPKLVAQYQGVEEKDIVLCEDFPVSLQATYISATTPIKSNALGDRSKQHLSSLSRPWKSFPGVDARNHKLRKYFIGGEGDVIRRNTNVLHAWHREPRQEKNSSNNDNEPKPKKKNKAGKYLNHYSCLICPDKDGEEARHASWICVLCGVKVCDEHKDNYHTMSAEDLLEVRNTMLKGYGMVPESSVTGDTTPPTTSSSIANNDAVTTTTTNTTTTTTTSTATSTTTSTAQSSAKAAGKRAFKAHPMKNINDKNSSESDGEEDDDFGII
jgi:hypothetical protein